MKIKIFVSLIICIAAWFNLMGQDELLPPLIKDCPVENLQLKTDRDVYISGEKLWFSVGYSLDRYD
jgi:hypothetical protein